MPETHRRIYKTNYCGLSVFLIHSSNHTNATGTDGCSLQKKIPHKQAERERETDRQTETLRDRDRERDRQADRQAGRQTDRDTKTQGQIQ